MGCLCRMKWLEGLAIEGCGLGVGWSRWVWKDAGRVFGERDLSIS